MPTRFPRLARRDDGSQWEGLTRDEVSALVEELLSALRLNDLTDVDTTGVQDGWTLRWAEDSSSWGVGAPGAGSGGTSDHSQLDNLDAPDQHPIGAIINLPGALNALESAVADLVVGLASKVAKTAAANDGDLFIRAFTDGEGNPVIGGKSVADLIFENDIATGPGSPGGVAELDGSGHVLSSQLPAYVDDVVEYANMAALPGTGESGKIYVTLDNNLTFRWSGSAYVEISASLALGETSSTAYRGDRGKTAYDHSQVSTGNPHGTTAADVGAIATSARGNSNGVASLDGDGTVPDIQLPSSIARDSEIGTQITAHDGSGTAHPDIRALIARRSWHTTLPSVPNTTYIGADTVSAANLAYGFLFELFEPTVFSAAHHVFSNAGTSLVARPALLRVTNLATLAWDLEIDFGAISVSSTGQKTAAITPTLVQPGVFFAASVCASSAPGQWGAIRAASTVGTLAGTVVANSWRGVWVFTSAAYGSAPAGGWPASGALAANGAALTSPLLHTLFSWELP